MKGAGYSYEDVLRLTPVQRQYVREWIKEEVEANNRSIEKITNKTKKQATVRSK